MKLDMGLTLDAQLLELQVLGVEHGRDEVLVRTEERCHDQERRIGTGERAAQDSIDHYFMRYHLRKPEGRWVVDEIAFDRPPVIGRTEVPQGDASAMNGIDYMAATLLFANAVIFGHGERIRWARVVAAAGLVPHGVAIAMRWAAVGHGP